MEMAEGLVERLRQLLEFMNTRSQGDKQKTQSRKWQLAASKVRRAELEYMLAQSGQTQGPNGNVFFRSNCDSSNFPLLIYIAPRLILISLQTSVDVALIERTEDAFEKLDRRAS